MAVPLPTEKQIEPVEVSSNLPLTFSSTSSDLKTICKSRSNHPWSKSSDSLSSIMESLGLMKLPALAMEMHRKMDERESFDAGMEKLLRANPKIVKAAMEEEKKEREEERKTKRASSSVPASSNRDT